MEISSGDAAVLNSVFNPELPYCEVVSTDLHEEQAPEEESEATLEAKSYELEGVKAAENGEVLDALNWFNKAIQILPGRASGYNNRAQALRLNGDVHGAMEDLNKAIALSQGLGKAACQAFTQRALIYKLEANEDDALEDFKAASKLGSDFAKKQVMAMNPYAALCNQMLNDVIKKIKTGET